MKAAKIAISIDSDLLERLDYFVDKKRFKTRSHAIQFAVNDALQHLEHRRLAQECAKLDPKHEQQLADEGLDEDYKEWPEF